MKELIKEIFEKNKITEYKTKVGIARDLEFLAKQIGDVENIWKSREGKREKRPIIMEDGEGNNSRFIFLTTKNYSRIEVDLNKFCVVSEDNFCKFSPKKSFVFEFNGKIVFSLPKNIINKFIFICGACKVSIKEILIRW
ncbi:MAG: hypothetical protein PWP54_1380 [Thermosipho sp. (in: thermotogales)]|nr:hypothetical protein [Thermosipho sp. (in: thermotogales)]